MDKMYDIPERCKHSIEYLTLTNISIGGYIDEYIGSKIQHTITAEFKCDCCNSIISKCSILDEFSKIVEKIS